MTSAFFRGVLVWNDLTIAAPVIELCKAIENEEPGSNFGFSCVSEDGLLGPSLGVTSEHMAMTAPLVCVALRDVNRDLTPQLRQWFGNWSRKRRGMPGVVAVIPGPETAERGHGRKFLKAVARVAGMDFVWGFDEFHTGVRQLAHARLVAA